jgi:hypothetical protein
MKNKMKTSGRETEKIRKEVMKYAMFVDLKHRENKDVKSSFEDRLNGRNITETVKKMKEEGLLVCLQIISDIIVLSSVPERKKEKSQTIGGNNEILLKSISEHQLRMDKLNKDIAEKSCFPNRLFFQKSFSILLTSITTFSITYFLNPTKSAFSVNFLKNLDFPKLP